MKFTDVDAVEHIYNSLDAGNVTDWYDSANEQSWNITTIAGQINISVYDDGGKEVMSKTYKLVEVD